MNKKAGVKIAIVAVLALLQCGCLIQDLNTFLDSLDDLVARFKTTEEAASVAQVEDLAPLVLEMQANKKELSELAHPECCDGMVATLDSAMNNYIKAYQASFDLDVFLGKLNNIATRFKSTEETASVTPRISLAPMILEMQNIKIELSELANPACSDTIASTLDSAMDNYIEAYQAFLGMESDYVVITFLNLAKSAMNMYDSAYAAYEADPQGECQKKLRDDEQTPYEIAEEGMNTFNADFQSFKADPLKACQAIK